jgi:hypothetical protein
MGGLFVSSEKADLLGCYFVFVLQKGWRFSLNPAKLHSVNTIECGNFRGRLHENFTSR